MSKLKILEEFTKGIQKMGSAKSGFKGHKGRPGRRGGSVARAGGHAPQTVSIRDGAVVVNGDPAFVQAVSTALNDVPDWVLQPIPRVVLESINRDRIGMTPDAFEKYYSSVNHPLTITQGASERAGIDEALGLTPKNVLGRAFDNSITLTQPHTADSFKETVLHEVGHHVDNLVITARTRPAPRTRYQYDTGGDKLDSVMKKEQKNLEHKLSVFGGGHQIYKTARERIRNITRTIPGKRYDSGDRAKTETFAQAYALMMTGHTDNMPAGILRVMGKYTKTRPPGRSVVARQ